MKIVHKDLRHGKISLIPECLDDLFVLEKIIVEGFIEGTEPTEYSKKNQLSVDHFYKIDSDLDEEENNEEDLYSSWSSEDKEKTFYLSD